MEAIVSESMHQIVETFNQQMEAFAQQLPKSSPPAKDSAGTLAASFNTFREFMLKSMKTLQNQIQLLAKQVDQIEMQGRRKILLLHGVAEEQNEDTSAVAARVVVEHLRLHSFTASNISRCHRMGRASVDRNRPILLKLRDQSIRDKMWSSKTALKGSGITLSEFLTKTRHDLFMAARDKFGVTKCWTRDGSIFALGSDDKRHRITCFKDLDTITQTQHKPATVTSKETVVRPAGPPMKTRRAATIRK